VFLSFVCGQVTSGPGPLSLYPAVTSYICA
jgi:hypothetical protein